MTSTVNESEMDEERTETEEMDSNENINEESSAQEEEKSEVEENSEGETENEEEENEDGEGISDHPKYVELNEKYLRLYAEFDNFRRRSAKESINTMQNASAGIIEKLLPVIENFSLAFSPEQKATKLEDFEKGIQMIFNSFKDILEEAGLEEINPEGEEFDPNLHEALMEQNHQTVEEGNVIQVFQKGYKVKSKIIKHAKVIVSKGPDENE